MTDREAFEAFITAPPFERSVSRFDDRGAWPGSYINYETDLAWKAWQAATDAALSAPATAPEPVAWMSPKRFYRTRAMALTNGEQLIEPLYLYPPATAPEPSWHDAPTVPGLWVSDFSWMAQKLGRETVEFYAKNRSIPSHRWYGPIPEDKP